MRPADAGPKEVYGCQGFPGTTIIDRDYMAELSQERQVAVRECCLPPSLRHCESQSPELCVAERSEPGESEEADRAAVGLRKGRLPSMGRKPYIDSTQESLISSIKAEKASQNGDAFWNGILKGDRTCQECNCVYGPVKDGISSIAYPDCQ